MLLSYIELARQSANAVVQTAVELCRMIVWIRKIDLAHARAIHNRHDNEEKGKPRYIGGGPSRSWSCRSDEPIFFDLVSACKRM